MNKNKLTKALKEYSEGKISMEKASELADVSIWKLSKTANRRLVECSVSLMLSYIIGGF